MAVHTTKVVLLLLALAFLYLMYFSVYRLFFHPLAKIPGPKLAALTGWHEFYFDCVKNGGGQHGFKMREMHDVYGNVQLPALCDTALLIIQCIRPGHPHQSMGSTHRW